jgi:hypothetical protein
MAAGRQVYEIDTFFLAAVGERREPIFRSVAPSCYALIRQFARNQ